MPNLELPLVSVCMPTYNRADRLRRAVDKLLKCSYANLEIVISDNASPDHTQQVCEELCRAHPHVRYFRQPANQGLMRNFEFARSQAAGKYFMWHSDDDYLDADYIEKCVERLEQEPALALVSGIGAYHRGDAVVRYYGNVIQATSRFGLARALRYVFLYEENSIFYGVYRREQVRHCHMPNCLVGDSVWVAEVLLNGRAKVLPESHIYRETSDNISATLERVVAGLGAPRWHGTYPWVAVPLLLARELAFGSTTVRDRNPVLRALVFASVFAVSFLKQAILMAMPKLPFGRRLYKKLFSSQMGI